MSLVRGSALNQESSVDEPFLVMMSIFHGVCVCSMPHCIVVLIKSYLPGSCPSYSSARCEGTRVAAEMSKVSTGR